METTIEERVSALEAQMTQLLTEKKAGQTTFLGTRVGRARFRMMKCMTRPCG